VSNSRRGSGSPRRPHGLSRGGRYISRQTVLLCRRADGIQHNGAFHHEVSYLLYHYLLASYKAKILRAVSAGRKFTKRPAHIIRRTECTTPEATKDSAGPLQLARQRFVWCVSCWCCKYLNTDGQRKQRLTGRSIIYTLDIAKNAGALKERI